MNLSETVIAAMIGAGATVATATFQLVAALRSRKADYKPKRGSGLRSTLAVCGLVLGAAVAGFGYSELRVQSEREESRAMEQRISDRLQTLANMQLAQLRNGNSEAGLLLTSASTSGAARSEAMARISACRPLTPGYAGDPVGCDATNANRIALCASVPSQASVLEVQLFAHADSDFTQWDTSRVAADQDIGGARFVAGIYEVEQGADAKAVCAQFLQWNSERGHVARVVVRYTTGAVTTAPAEPPTNARSEPVTADPGDDRFPVSKRAVDAVPGILGGDSGTPSIAAPDPDIAAPEPARGSIQAVIAAQP
jgi:hypothetical protein